MKAPLVPLRRLSVCLDGRRIPLNREQRGEMQGDIPYWGAGGVLDYVDDSLFDEPLVLLGEDGAPFFDPGKAVAYYVEGPAWVNNHIHVLRPITCDARYLTYALNAVDYANYITGSTRDKLTQDDLKEILVPQPPFDEQRRIADFLDAETARIDALMTARRRQTACLEELWEARLASRVERLIERHGTVTLRRLIRSVEQGWSPQCDDHLASPQDWAVLKTSAVSSGEFDPLQHKRLPTSYDPDLRFKVKDGDLLMTRGSGSPSFVGIAAVARTDGRRLLLSDLLYRINIDERVSANFAALVLGSRPVRSRTSLLMRGQSGQTIKLRAEDVRSIEFPDVPNVEQKRFASELQDERVTILSAVATIEKSLSLLSERRMALITAAVTGECDVSTAGGRGLGD